MRGAVTLASRAHERRRLATQSLGRPATGLRSAQHGREEGQFLNTNRGDMALPCRPSERPPAAARAQLPGVTSTTLNRASFWLMSRARGINALVSAIAAESAAFAELT